MINETIAVNYLSSIFNRVSSVIFDSALAMNSMPLRPMTLLLET